MPDAAFLCRVPILPSKESATKIVPFKRRHVGMFQTDLLKSKRILITGGGTGIGRAMAERFLQLGATVYICGRRLPVVQQTAQELAASTGGHIAAFACDVRDSDDVEKLIVPIWAQGALDTLV